jgi:hypothetical protein
MGCSSKDILIPVRQGFSVKKNAALMVVARQPVQDADPQVEAVKDGVTGKQDAKQDKPDNMKIHDEPGRARARLL